VRLITHIGRSLAFHRRMHLPVALGVMTATATLTGALLVGDSMRASLRDVALGGLGKVDHALLAQRFFTEDLTAELASSPGFSDRFSNACPLILLQGGMVHANTGARVNRITVLGVRDSFWQLVAPDDREHPTIHGSRGILLNEQLARKLEARVGDDVLVRLGKPSAISRETILGRRDDTSRTLRLSVTRIIPSDGAGRFSLKPRQSLPGNAWIDLSTLQAALEQPGRINAVLVTEKKQQSDLHGRGQRSSQQQPQEQLDDLLRERLTLKDLGLSLHIDPVRGYATLESDRLLIEPAVERATMQSAGPSGVTVTPILTYLANAISMDDPPSTIGDPETTIPYSTVTAIDPTGSIAGSVHLVGGSTAADLEPGEVLLNQWAADDLQAAPGQRIGVTYYVAEPFGRLEEHRASFLLTGIVSMNDADPGLTPSYPGVTDAKTIADWDPPFPINFGLIRDKDEAYWDTYRAAPKALIHLDDGRRLWTQGHERFGRSTSIRIMPRRAADQSPHGGLPSEEPDLSTTAANFESRLLERLNPSELGLSFDAVRARALVASTGSTDFGMLFVSFSFFLIVSAAMLVALLFGLGAEQRSTEVGTLLALGFDRKTITRLLIGEGLVVACAGAAVGLLAAVGYAWLMLTGLRSWWSAAVGAPFLKLDAPWTTLVIGFCASVVIALASIVWSIRRLGRSSAQALFSGRCGKDAPVASRFGIRLTAAVGLAAFVLAGVMTVLSAMQKAIDPTIGFFGGGAALLVAALCAAKIWVDTNPPFAVRKPGAGACLYLGFRNAPRHPRRSLLTIGLIASATFIITAIEALRLDTDIDTSKKYSPTGGFAMLAESAIPLPYDLNTKEGREELGISEADGDILATAEIMPFRLRPGDDTSCRDLYRPTSPRIIGANDAMIERGGFSFASTIALDHAGGEDRDRNPWTLLSHSFDDGAIPVIGDQNAVMWQLHSGLGKDLVITDEQGRDVHLRFVALLAGSVLQDELIVAEPHFIELFPSISGHAFFLINAHGPEAPGIARALEASLSSFAFDVEPTVTRLGEYLAVQNTYLSTFQMLGGVGLILGTVGLAVVLLRNVWERRAELALMRALGFSRAALRAIVLTENAVLVIAGLVAGAVPALVAVMPHIVGRWGSEGGGVVSLPWASLSLTLLGVLVVGVGVAALALVDALRAPLLPALRHE